MGRGTADRMLGLCRRNIGGSCTFDYTYSFFGEAPMLEQSAARVVGAYSRKDGAEFAAELRKSLAEQDLSIWQDIVALEGGRDWWSQIEEALRSKALQHFVLVVTPAALASPVVRREIRLARQ